MLASPRLASPRLGRRGRLGNLVGYVLYEQTKRAQPESKFGFSDPPFRHDGRQVRFRILERDYRGEELDRFRLLREQTANLSTWQSRAS